jgi:murein DD-endopeptidase MepM/ murein hydrolase activator NlpD
MPKNKKNPLQKAIRRVKLLAKRQAKRIKIRFDVTTSYPILKSVWILNALLLLFYVSLFVGPQYFRSSVLDYSDIKSDPFDGTIYPISYVPNWLNVKNTYKTLKYDEIPVSEFVSIPRYDANVLGNTDNKDKEALLMRFTYITPYMGSYRMNYQEYDGSHPAVDIRAPLGTPILAIANGVVTKVKDTETGDGKYVIIRHDNVNVNGTTETVYSVYEHVNDITAVEGTKIKRGDLVARVGMTGITTTPHLHFQIDRASAPYHPYWPYSFSDANKLGLDFFTAINVGLGKENAIAYTIHPLEVIQNNLKPLVMSENREALVAGSTSVPEAPAAPEATSSPAPLNSAPEEIKPTETTQPVTNTDMSTEAPKIDTPLSQGLGSLRDVTPENRYYTAIMGLVEKGVIKGYSDGNFYSERPISRREAIIIVFRLFDVAPDATVTSSIFRDIKKDDIVKPYLDYALDLGIVSPNKYYRPDDTVSRAELVKLLVQTAGIKPEISDQRFGDVTSDNKLFPYVNTFGQIMGLKGNKFEPNVQMDRGSVANVLWAFSQKIGK